ncbi:hypothetical protein A2U01_0048775, partial [Trifolium medium]|nr:hypothetical protein [Trifolium medium]
MSLPPPSAITSTAESPPLELPTTARPDVGRPVS